VLKREAVAEQDDHLRGCRQEMVSCGKGRCRKCAEGPGHGPYWYRYYRRDGKLVSKYVGKERPAAGGDRRAVNRTDEDGKHLVSAVDHAADEPASHAPEGSTGGNRGPDRRASRHEDEVSSLTAQISFLDEEIAVLRRRLADSPRQVRLLEERLRETEASLTSVTSQNERLASTLREARDQIVALKEEVDRLAQPPSGFGIFLEAQEDSTADVFTGGRKMRVNVSPNVDLEGLRPGQEVVLNEALNIVLGQDFETIGEVEELILEKVPDIAYTDIGGLTSQIEQIRDAIELPYLHALPSSATPRHPPARQRGPPAPAWRVHQVPAGPQDDPLP
jgi:hypothetical protein